MARGKATGRGYGNIGCHREVLKLPLAAERESRMLARRESRSSDHEQA